MPEYHPTIGDAIGYAMAHNARLAARTASGQQPETTPCGHCKGSGADPEDEGDYVPEVHRHNPFSVGPCPECNGKGTAVGQPAEAQATDEARPPRVQWGVEYLRAGQPGPWWDYDQRAWDTREKAQAEIDRYAGSSVRRRLVREDTTWTVEDETR